MYTLLISFKPLFFSQLSDSKTSTNNDVVLTRKGLTTWLIKKVEREESDLIVLGLNRQIKFFTYFPPLLDSFPLFLSLSMETDYNNYEKWKKKKLKR